LSGSRWATVKRVLAICPEGPPAALAHAVLRLTEKWIDDNQVDPWIFTHLERDPSLDDEGAGRPVSGRVNYSVSSLEEEAHFVKKVLSLRRRMSSPASTQRLRSHSTLLYWHDSMLDVPRRRGESLQCPLLSHVGKAAHDVVAANFTRRAAKSSDEEDDGRDHWRIFISPLLAPLALLRHSRQHVTCMQRPLHETLSPSHQRPPVRGGAGE